jgi:hypothetical protein
MISPSFRPFFSSLFKLKSFIYERITWLV